MRKIKIKREQYGLVCFGNKYKHNTIYSSKAAKLCIKAIDTISNSIYKAIDDCMLFQLTANEVS